MEQLTINMKKHRIDTDGVIGRLGGNEKLYLSICKKFLNDVSYSSIQQAIIEGDYIEARRHIHTLKGVAVNLGFIYLYSLCSRLLTELDEQNLYLFHKDLICLGQEYDFIVSILKENF